MSWLDRFGGGDGPGLTESAPPIESRERAAPGLAVLFASLRPDGGHCILDLGSADGPRLGLLSEYARKIRFAALLPDPPRGEDLLDVLDQIAGDEPFDVVLAWDVFDRIDPDERVAVVERIVKATAPGARLHTVLDASGAETRQPVRIDVLAVDRVSEEPVGPPESAGPPLLPRQVEQLLDPFEVTTGVSLRTGQREYVARRPE